MKMLKYLQLYGFTCLVLLGSLAKAEEVKDPLPSWNEGQVKQSIIQFVQAVTDKTSPTYVDPKERIAAFDNDGTLWVEQPLYTQAVFMLDRLKTLIQQQPALKNQKLFKALLSGDRKAISQLSVQDLEKIIAITHSGMTVNDFQGLVQAWLATAKDPHFNRPYTELIYQPMLEAMDYLRAHDFKIYLVTGGGQEFVRAYSQQSYEVMPENVIGSAIKTKYSYQANQPVLIKQPEVLLIDDHAGKPQAINLFIGRKPLIAFGNSVGDQQMLEWTQSDKHRHLMLLVHHDDPTREYAYGPKSKIGTFSEALMDEAKKNNWEVISMKNDWKVIFPFEMK